MECEICGKKEAVCLAYLEGAKMNACAGCARGGKIHYYFNEESQPLPKSFRGKAEDEISDGFGKKIKTAREIMHLSLEEFGKLISEKANYLDHLEHEKSLPSLELAKKLEKFLKIRLIETGSAPSGQEEKVSYGKKELTLMDIAEIDSGKKKKK